MRLTLSINFFYTYLLLTQSVFRLFTHVYSKSRHWHAVRERFLSPEIAFWGNQRACVDVTALGWSCIRRHLTLFALCWTICRTFRLRRVLLPFIHRDSQTTKLTAPLLRFPDNFNAFGHFAVTLDTAPLLRMASFCFLQKFLEGWMCLSCIYSSPQLCELYVVITPIYCMYNQ